MKLRYVLLLAIMLGLVLFFVLKQTPSQQPAIKTTISEKKKNPEVIPEPAKEASPEIKAEDKNIPGRANTQTPAPYAVACKYLSEAMAKCEPYICETQHPEVKDFIVKHTVAGLLPNGLCVHIQTAPKDITIVCNYSPEMRILVAKNMRAENKGKMSEQESNVLSAGFDAECEVVDNRTGKVINRAVGGDAKDTMVEKPEGKKDDATTDHLP